MPRRLYYLSSLLLVFIVPSIIAGYFVIPTIPLKQLLEFVALVTIVGSIWDLWATRHGKNDPVWLWTFNKKDTLGVTFLGLPIEEYLFYVASSVYVIFLWQSILIAMNTGNGMYYLLIPILGLWTFLCISIPYKLSPKRDRLIG